VSQAPTLSPEYEEEQLTKAKTPRERESLRRTIAAIGGQIHSLVYEICRLMKEEIRIAEGRLE
jgi:predicted  nucleic acid-binding Zn-ribbon protein